MSKKLNAVHLTALKMHWSLFQHGERTSLELSAFLPASQGLNVPSPVLTLHIQASEDCTENKYHTHTFRVARKLWYRTSHHILQLILACIRYIWHPFFLWFISLSMNFCTMKYKVHFFFPRYL